MVKMASSKIELLADSLTIAEGPLWLSKLNSLIFTQVQLNKVYKRLEDNNMKSRLVLQIHDELVIETHKDEIKLVEEILIDCMRNPFDLMVPLEININIGNTLFDMK